MCYLFHTTLPLYPPGEWKPGGTVGRPSLVGEGRGTSPLKTVGDFSPTVARVPPVGPQGLHIALGFLRSPPPAPPEPAFAVDPRSQRVIRAESYMLFMLVKPTTVPLARR